MPRPAELTFELMRTFLVLVEEGGSATRAARRLGIGQPSLSRRLAHLREGGPVLTRPWLVQEGKKCQLTEEGQKALPAVRQLVQDYDNLRNFVDRPREVSCACGRESAGTFVRQAVLAFRQRGLGARVRIAQMRGRARIEGVASGSLDLGLVTDDEPTIEAVARRPLYTEVVASDPLVLACAGDAPWAEAVRAGREAGLRPRDLAKLQAPFVLPEPEAGVRRAIDEALRSAGVLGQVRVELEVGGWDTILGYVRDGLGVGIVSADVARRAAEGLVLKGLDPRAFRSTELRLIARRRSGQAGSLDLSEEGELFLADLRAALASHRDRLPPQEGGPAKIPSRR